jgi:hypothetical protein
MFIATEARMRAALEKHLSWIDEKLKIDGKEREEIEGALWACEKEFVVGDDAGEGENEEGEDESAKGSKKNKAYIQRYVRHKFILERLIDSLSAQDDEDRNQVFHVINHNRNANDEECLHFDFNKKRPANVKHTASLAKPKKIVLQSTLDNFGKLMSCEKQKRILCQLNKSREPSKPEDFEEKVRVPCYAAKQQKCRNLGERIKLQVAKKLFENISRIVKKKISKKMSNKNVKSPVTQQFREMEKTILMTLMIINGVPKSYHEIQIYNKFTSIVSQFLITALKSQTK